MEITDAPTDRLTAFGNRLIETHRWLREELAQLRDDVDSYLDGHGERPQDLRAHCLAFCTAVTRHHTDEDDDIFPALAEHLPELRPALAKLRHDHGQVAETMRQFQDLLGRLKVIPDAAEARHIRAELDRLATLLESHLGREERVLVPALDSLGAR